MGNFLSNCDLISIVLKKIPFSLSKMVFFFFWFWDELVFQLKKKIETCCRKEESDLVAQKLILIDSFKLIPTWFAITSDFVSFVWFYLFDSKTSLCKWCDDHTKKKPYKPQNQLIARKKKERIQVYDFV